MIKQPRHHLAQPVAATGIGGLAADEEDVQPVPQQIVIQAQDLHLQRPRPIEAQVIEEALGLQHGLADVPMDVAIEGIHQLLVTMLQVETPHR
ncbi:hypothetical protein D3C75_1213250 [compost metagenome]